LREVTVLATAPALEGGALAAALDRPVGAPRIEEGVRGRRVLIAVADPTRATGVRRYLPGLVERLHRAGAREIAFAVASGLHRTPSAADVEAIVGPEIAGRHAIHLHDPDHPGLEALGVTSGGTPVLVHPETMRHDAVVLTGAVGFHYYAGFSGGRKAVVPGLAGRATIVGNHLRALRRDGSRHPAARAGRLDGNPVHRDMAEGAARVGPAYLVNTVMRIGGGIERLFAGHWRRAHVAACRYLRNSRRVRVDPRRLVVVSAGGHPSDVDLIQSHKAFEAAYAALRPGGVLVLVASCAQGAGHPDFLPCFELASTADLLELVRHDYRVYRQTALAWRRKADGCRLVLVSDLDPRTARELGAEPARDLEEAFRIAREVLPAGEEGWVFPAGARVLVESG
jgi:nickel-dependent lactate racemase